MLKDRPGLDEQQSVLENDSAHVSGQACLIVREVKNGVLTTSSLELLKKVASKTEWAELERKLTVKAALIYPKSHMYKDYDSWAEAVKMEQPKNQMITETTVERHCILDNPPGPWLKLEFNAFRGPLLKARKEAKSASSPQEKYLKALIN
uniref:Uncharacterized protein n=1 Tax=Caulerpa cliftonii TaxID=1004391 RepID=A0A1C9JBV1_9CHLO|nr:hypothetical protein [Caulerpa cliftonii]AOP19335.1 hypothetical protein [Caulerpa cliftonii]